MYLLRLFRFATIAFFLNVWLAPAFAGPIIYSFFGGGVPGAINGELFDGEYELRFEGNTDDILNEESIANLLGTIHLDDGRVGTINEPMTISVSREIDTFLSTIFSPTGQDIQDAVVNHSVQREILLFPSEQTPPPQSASSALDQLVLTSAFRSFNPQVVKLTAEYALDRDFELTGSANVRSLATDFATQSQNTMRGSLDFQTSLGLLNSSNFGTVTFTSTLVPEPTGTANLPILVVAGLFVVRRLKRRTRFRYSSQPSPQTP